LILNIIVSLFGIKAQPGTFLYNYLNCFIYYLFIFIVLSGLDLSDSLEVVENCVLIQEN